ncbi:hypothetical protein R69888_00988 [Paraburkholderia haematera]|uniref:Uncharacterized protein n=1 Tax=Paraburkholderia haematera TaxID=2793077 RepID=A0ABM8QP96_9BURK|nr:hypothetical protein R69888_00988 [Paraburkholderia haematera]
MKKVEAAGRNRPGRPTPAFVTFYVHYALQGPTAVRTQSIPGRDSNRHLKAHQGELQWA